MKRILLFLAVISFLLGALCIPAMASEPLTAIRAVRISATEVVVELSDSLDEKGFSSPFVALRRMQMEAGSPKSLAWDGDTPLQAAASSWRFWSEDDRSRVIFAFDEAMLDEYLAASGSYYKRGYRTYLGIEEKDPPSGHDHATLQGVQTRDGRELRSTLPGPGGSWDGVYLQIETDYTYGKGSLGENPVVTLPAGDETQGEEKPTEQSGCGAVLPAALPGLILLPAVAFRKRR